MCALRDDDCKGIGTRPGHPSEEAEGAERQGAKKPRRKGGILKARGNCIGPEAERHLSGRALSRPESLAPSLLGVFALRRGRWSAGKCVGPKGDVALSRSTSARSPAVQRLLTSNALQSLIGRDAFHRVPVFKLPEQPQQALP
jgi:hypothetical protein